MNNETEGKLWPVLRHYPGTSMAEDFNYNGSNVNVD
jgi:hypothetical protein